MIQLLFQAETPFAVLIVRRLAMAFSAVLDILEKNWVEDGGLGNACLVSNVIEAPKAKNTMGVIIRLRCRGGYLKIRTDSIRRAQGNFCSILDKSGKN